MVRNLKKGTILTILIVIPLALFYLACNEGTGDPATNVSPDTKLSQSPAKGSSNNLYYQEFYWYGSDNDGYVPCYIYRIQRADNMNGGNARTPDDMYKNIKDANKMTGKWEGWIWTTSTADTLYFTAGDVGNEYYYRREIRSIDNTAKWDYTKASSSSIDDEYFEDVGDSLGYYDTKDRCISEGNNEGIATPLGQQLTELTPLETRRALKPTEITEGSYDNSPADTGWFSVTNKTDNLPFIEGIQLTNWDDAGFIRASDDTTFDYTNIERDDSTGEYKLYKIWDSSKRPLITYPTVLMKVTMNTQFGKTKNPGNVRGFVVIIGKEQGGKIRIEKPTITANTKVYETGEKGVSQAVVDLREHWSELENETGKSEKDVFTKVTVAIWAVDKANSVSEKCWAMFWDIMPVSYETKTVCIHFNIYQSGQGFKTSYKFFERYIGGAPDNNPDAITNRYKEYSSSAAEFIPRDLDCFKTIVWTGTDFLQAQTTASHDVLHTFEKYLTAYLDKASIKDTRNLFMFSIFPMSFRRTGAASAAFKTKYLHLGTYSYEFENGQFGQSYDYIAKTLNTLQDMGESNFPSLVVDKYHCQKDRNSTADSSMIKEVVAFNFSSEGIDGNAIYKHGNVKATQGGSTPVVGFKENNEGRYKIVYIGAPLYAFLPHKTPAEYSSSDTEQSNKIRNICNYVLHTYFFK
ncbi:MAG: hypothetical protein JXA60_11560 [Candidatus Coatesbacteria bacterium]|nr:hypothetical protein [Candidatus Coatesbacteria bacterium]